MKNLYLLPTDKPSRLHDYNYISLLGLSKENLQWRQGMHIYITSEEEIKKRDYVLSDSSIGALYLDGVINTVEMLAENQWKKVILTTDQDLIEDGVQIISDEFLEWFIKNPSCEFAEYDKNYNRGNSKYYYKIITPKEKVKHGGKVLNEEEVMSGRSSAYEFIDFDKKETLEEAVESFTKNNSNETDLLLVKTIAEKVGFICGAKWQQERSYSEEDMLEASKYGYNFHKTTQFPSQEFEESCIRNTQQWLTTIKKK
jgi:hypothetical protein